MSGTSVQRKRKKNLPLKNFAKKKKIYFDHEKVGHVERLGVGLLDLHFKIKPHELGQVAARVAVLSPEHWPDLGRRSQKSARWSMY